MRYSQLFGKSQRTAPHDADSVNARLLTQAGFIDQLGAGIYSFLPLGYRVLRKIEDIVRDEMNNLGAQEIFMPSLHPKEFWQTTGRWDSVDVLFKLKSQTNKEYSLGASHEEVVTPLARKFLRSYKDLPFAVYQINTKFRDELRAKSGILRGREFRMKDMYSFHASHDDLKDFYNRTLEAYVRVFSRCGLDIKVVEASGGIFTQNQSHEFHALTPAGEDVIVACENCEFGQNTEIATLKEGDKCPKCGGKLSKVKGIEVGNIFDLGTKYTDAFGLDFVSEAGEKKRVLMGCYGIGTTRLLGAVVESFHDDKGIIWPKSVAPFAIHLVTLDAKDKDVASKIESTAESIYDSLVREEGFEVLFDDRSGLRAGEKFADADLIGIPLRIIISEKTLKENSVELKLRNKADDHLVKIGDLHDEVEEFVSI